MRRVYSDFLMLTEHTIARGPLKQFARWFRAAEHSRAIRYANVMCLSTVDRRGNPDGRFVLLKGFDTKGFVFYGNCRSVKGVSLAAHPHAALTLYWEPLHRQIRIQGRTTLVSAREADAYFRTRPRMSQLAAWASPQSAVVEDRAWLERRMATYAQKFRGQPVPRPPFWVGYRVVPSKIEFWQERPNRLHDRFVYTTRGRRWRVQRVAP